MEELVAQVLAMVLAQVLPMVLAVARPERRGGGD